MKANWVGFLMALAWACSAAPVSAAGTTGKGKTSPTVEKPPRVLELRGIQVGMTRREAMTALGAPFDCFPYPAGQAAPIDESFCRGPLGGADGLDFTALNRNSDDTITSVTLLNDEYKGDVSALIEALTSKFGPPKMTQRETLMNAFGATWPGITYMWQSEKAQLTAILGRPKSASVSISLDDRALVEQYLARRKQRAAGQI